MRAFIGLNLERFLKRELKDRMANIFIDAPAETRARRELEKVNRRAIEEGKPTITFDEMLQRVHQKMNSKQNITQIK